MSGSFTICLTPYNRKLKTNVLSASLNKTILFHSMLFPQIKLEVKKITGNFKKYLQSRERQTDRQTDRRHITVNKTC